MTKQLSGRANRSWKVMYDIYSNNSSSDLDRSLGIVRVVKSDLTNSPQRGGGSRKGGALSMRKALKLAKKAGIEIEHKRKSGMVKLKAPNGDSISVSARDSEVTKNTAAWLSSHGVEW